MANRKRKRTVATVSYHERLTDALVKCGRVIIEYEPEELPIEGNASACGPETDRKVNEWIRDQLRSGNQWAWCTVTVTVTFRGFTGTDTLGACSYESEDAFKVPGGYFTDMVRYACEDIARQLIDARAAMAAGASKPHYRPGRPRKMKP